MIFARRLAVSFELCAGGCGEKEAGTGFDGGKGEAVEWGWAEDSEGAAVLGGGVSLVRGEAVAGMLGIERAEEAVAMDLGDDGGGGYGQGERVAMDELGLGAGVVEPHGVNEEVVGGKREVADGGEHGKARGLVDVDVVDGGRVDLGDGDGQGRGANKTVEGFTLEMGELLGVLEARVCQRGNLLRQNDSGGDDRAEESTTTDLVHTCNGAEADKAQGLFVLVGADQKPEHALPGTSR